MPALLSPPPAFLHSTRNPLKQIEALDELDVIKTQMELLKLNEVSRGKLSPDFMAKKRLRPSFLVALVDSFGKKKKKNQVPEDEKPLFSTPKRKERRSLDNPVVLSMKPLSEEDVHKEHNASKLQGAGNVDHKGKMKFGSTASLCSLRTYKLRQENKSFARFRRVTVRRKFSFTPSSLETNNQTPNFGAEYSTQQVIHAKPPMPPVQVKRDEPVAATYSTTTDTEEGNRGHNYINKALKSCKKKRNSLGGLMNKIQTKAENIGSSPVKFRRRISDISERKLRRSKSLCRRQGSEKNEDTKPKSSLLNVLADKASTQAFRDFLKGEFSEENLDFWIECEAYKNLKPTKHRKAATKIYSQFLAPSAPREVNINSQTRARTERKITNPNRETFVEAQTCIFDLMKRDPFRRFLNSEFCT